MTAFIRIKNILKNNGTFYQSFKNKYMAFIFNIVETANVTLQKINEVELTSITSLNLSYVTSDPIYPTFPSLTSNFWENVETLIPIVGTNKFLGKFTFETNIYYIILGKIDGVGNPNSVGCGTDILLEVTNDGDSEVNFLNLKLESKPENDACSIVSQLVGSSTATVLF